MSTCLYYTIRCLLILELFCGCYGFIIHGLTTGYWEGYLAYFAVPRQRVADKLSQLQGDAAKLRLPSDPIMPNIIGPDQHVIAVACGKLTAESVEEALPEELRNRYTTETDIVQFYIPYLTTDMDSEPIFKLALNSLASPEKPLVQPYVVFPVHEVDYVSVSWRELRVENGSEILAMSLPNRQFCSSSKQLDEEFHYFHFQYTTSDLAQITKPSICDESLGSGLDICSDMIPPYSCQFSFWDRFSGPCILKPMTLTSVSSAFKNVSLLNGDEGNAVATFYYEGDFSVDLSTDCY